MNVRMDENGRGKGRVGDVEDRVLEPETRLRIN